MNTPQTTIQKAECAKSLVCAAIELTQAESSIATSDMTSSDERRLLAAYEVLRMHDDAANILFMLYDELDSMIADFKGGEAG